jgi:hypothetical protein
VKIAVTFAVPGAAHTGSADPTGTDGEGSTDTEVKPWLLQPPVVLCNNAMLPLLLTGAVQVTLSVMAEEPTRGDVPGRLAK